MKSITFATLIVAVAGLIYTLVDERPSTQLSRFNCVDITVFAPLGSKSADEHCAKYGGVAQTDEKGQDALVILVRNQPMGGFEGREYTVR